MKKRYQFILLLSFLSIFFTNARVEAWRHHQKPAYSEQKLAISKTSLYIDSYEFGPAVSKLVLELNSEAYYLDWSQVKITTAGVQRQVTNAYLSDANGNSLSNATPSKHITLELDVDYDTNNPSLSASPFTFDLSSYRNQWVSSYFVSISHLKIQTTNTSQMQTLSAEQEAIDNRLTPTADRFSDRSWVSGIQYAAYQPQAISGGEKNPLIIWLHGIGEVGTDLNLPLLSSEVSSLTEESIQSHFHSTGSGEQQGAYVLVPQSSVAWGENQTANLKTLIDTYLISHPDIDSSRIYLIGASNGGGMVINMGSTYPDFFAALVPIAAYYPYDYSYDATTDVFTYLVSDTTYNALKNQPMWLIHTRADQSILVDNSVLPFYKAMIDRGADNKWLSYYETVTGTDLSGKTYNGHWAWIYLFNNQVTGVQSTENTKNMPALWGMVATDPTQGGASKATTDGVEYHNIFDWLNAQKHFQ